MRRLLCLLLCAVMVAGIFPMAGAAKKDTLLEVTVSTHSNIADPNDFEIDGLYCDNVFYINAGHIAILTGADVISDDLEKIAFTLHHDSRYIEIHPDQTLEEHNFNSYDHEIPVVTYGGRLWVSAPDILRYVGADVTFGADETADVHMMVSMPYTVQDLYGDYQAVQGYLFDWSEADGWFLDPGDQLYFSALSTALFEYDATVVGFVVPAYVDYLDQTLSQDAILTIMRNDTTELLDPYFEGYQIFGDISSDMDLTVDALEELCSVLSDDVCAEYFRKSTKSLVKTAGSSLSIAGTVLEVTGDYLSAVETAQQFQNMAQANKELFTNTLLRAADSQQLYQQNPNFFEAARTANSLITGTYKAEEYARKQAVYSLLTEAVNTGFTSLHPAIAAADFAMGIMENLPIVEDLLAEDVRIAYADQCRYAALVAESLLDQDSLLNRNTDNTIYQDRMRYDMILSLKSSITARTLLYDTTFWLTEDAKRTMKAEAKAAAELLSLAYQAKSVAVGRMDWRNEDLTWIAKLAGMGSCGQVVGLNGKIYYWEYDSSSYVSGERYHGNAQNKLVCMDEKGKTSTVGTFNAYGAFAVTNRWIIVNKYGGGIGLTRHDGSESRSFGYAMDWVSPNGKYMIYHESDGTLYTVSLTTFEKERLVSDGRFVTAHNGVAYFTQSDSETIRLYSWRPGDSTILELYQSPGDYNNAYSHSYLYVAQMRFTEDHLFICYGASGGTGSFFQGGKIVRMGYDGTGAQVVAGEDELVDWYFTVSKNGTVHSQELNGTIFYDPMDETMVEDGTLYQIDPESGQLITLLNQRDYRLLGSEPLEQDVDSYAIRLEFAEVVEGKAYCVLSRCRIGEGIGWRLTYSPEETVMLVRDLDSGDVDVLFTIYH